MAKFLLRLKARKLRKRGISVKAIAKFLSVSKGTVSLWVRDMVLTVEQLEQLRQNSIKGSELGRLKNSLAQKKKRLDLLETSIKDGKSVIGVLTDRELLLTGIALYWGEGSKKKRSVELVNSDPGIMNLFIYWLQKCFQVKREDLICSVGINALHRVREQEVKEFWIRVTKLPLIQFRKTSFKKVKNVKVYDNFHDHYGTLRISLSKPSAVYYKIIGLIEGLAQTPFNLVPLSGRISTTWQGSSVVEHFTHNEEVASSILAPATASEPDVNFHDF
jgi:hypothetical protein